MLYKDSGTTTTIIKYFQLVTITQKLVYLT